MKNDTEYKILYDKNGKKRATICKVHPDWSQYVTGIGMAFCSDEDKWDDITGQRMAYARAMRALKGRKPCIAQTWRIYKYVLNLRYSSLAYLMRLTNHRIKYFEKGFFI